MALLITVSSLPPFFRLFNIDSILTWMIGLAFFGGLAFGLGWLYATLFRFKGRNAGEGAAATVPSEGAEEDLYAAVAMEIQRGDLRQGLWAKALSESEYDAQRAKAKYIKFRAEKLRGEQIQALHETQSRAEENRNRAEEQTKYQKEQAFRDRETDHQKKATKAGWIAVVFSEIGLVMILIGDGMNLVEAAFMGTVLALVFGFLFHIFVRFVLALTHKS